jgi:glutaredoxin
MKRWLAVLSHWLGRRRRARPDLHVVVYSRKQCSHCEEARELLELCRRKYGFVLEVLDVDASDELKRLHGNWVPVVMINGKPRFRGQVNPVLLRRILDGTD